MTRKIKLISKDITFYAQIDSLSEQNYFPPKEDQLSQQEVAAMFNRSVQTICNWTKTNKIPFFRVGRFPIYSRKQLIQYAAKNQQLIDG
ncbi:helix-turn-helix domain-containing protein [Chryseobacterium arthrosphaerae]|uniref:helix-turn-helix domain-containing protein n=1 Tax=Chryseobacterium arthrosphaerae TaxID=651561 RepID=UPI0031D709D4